MCADQSPDLLDAVAPSMQSLLGLADAARSLGDSGLPLANSRAMAELAAEATLENAQLREPIHSAHSLLGVAAFAAGDHLRNYARLFASQPVPVYSHLVLARACLDACSFVFWLGEPQISAKCRAQRYLVSRVHNAKQKRRSPIPAIREKGKEIIREVREGCDAAGWRFLPRLENNESPQVEGEEMPALRI